MVEIHDILNDIQTEIEELRDEVSSDQRSYASSVCCPSNSNVK